MQYTVWSRGELIGSTDLGFRGVGFDRCRSGHFLPNARGDELMEELASDSHCMRAYMHRDYRDADGNDLLDREYVNCDWFADVAGHLHQTAQFELVLRDENNVALSVAEIGIQDKHPDWPPPLREVELAAGKLAEHVRTEEREQNQRLRASNVTQHEQYSAPAVSDVDRKLLEQLLADDEDQMEGCEYFDTPCDITMPVDWGYDDHQGDNELGSGWNSTLRDVPNFARYQVHVMLADG